MKVLGFQTAQLILKHSHIFICLSIFQKLILLMKKKKKEKILKITYLKEDQQLILKKVVIQMNYKNA